MNYCSKCTAALPGDTRFCAQCGYDQSEAVPAHHMKPGTMLEYRYWVGRALGEGGFGITYIGRDTKLDMTVAIKEYYPNGYVSRSNTLSAAVENSLSADRKDFFEKGRERFLKEARILARFSGEPGVVNVRDFFEQNNTAYIVMEYLDGLTLKDYLYQNGTMPAQQVLHLLMPVMHSLQKIHAQDLIHRDISPDNIMLINGKVKLLDFGAARDVTAVGNKSLSVMLKPGYAPEEQYRSRGIQGPWTDVYALSATIYKCITGITPDDSTQRVFCDEVKKPGELGIEIDANFEAALMKGMAVSQNDRYQSIGELLDGLQNTAPAATTPIARPVQQQDGGTVGLFTAASAAPVTAPAPSPIVMPQAVALETDSVTVGGAETVALQDTDGDEIVMMGITPSEEHETVCLFDEDHTFEEMKEQTAPVAASLAYAAEQPTQEGVVEPVTAGGYRNEGDEEVIPVPMSVLNVPSKMAGNDEEEEASETYGATNGVGAVAGAYANSYSLHAEEDEEEKKSGIGFKILIALLIVLVVGLIIWGVSSSGDSSEDNYNADDTYYDSNENESNTQSDGVVGEGYTGEPKLVFTDSQGNEITSLSMVEGETKFVSATLVGDLPENWYFMDPDVGVATGVVSIDTTEKDNVVTIEIKAIGNGTVPLNVYAFDDDDQCEITEANLVITVVEKETATTSDRTETTTSKPVNSSKESSSSNNSIANNSVTVNYATITFSGNGGIASTSSRNVNAAGTYGTLPTATRTGYSFAGWYTSATGGKKVTASSVLASKSNHTLYAQWTPNTYQVTYDANGGTGAPSSQTKTYGQTLTLSSTVPTRSGYVFYGWGTSAKDLSADYKSGASYTVNSATKLYAIWAVKTIPLINAKDHILFDKNLWPYKKSFSFQIKFYTGSTIKEGVIFRSYRDVSDTTTDTDVGVYITSDGYLNFSTYYKNSDGTYSSNSKNNRKLKTNSYYDVTIAGTYNDNSSSRKITFTVKENGTSYTQTISKYYTMGTYYGGWAWLGSYSTNYGNGQTNNAPNIYVTYLKITNLYSVSSSGSGAYATVTLDVSKLSDTATSTTSGNVKMTLKNTKVTLYPVVE